MTARLIVGFDGSDASNSAIRWAADEAEIWDASVRVVSSYSIPLTADPYGMAGAYLTPDEMQKVKAGCFAGLHAAVTQSIHHHPKVGFDYEAVDEDAAPLIIREAEHGDLVVVGGTGAGVVKSYMVGSVLATLLHASPCPVVVVPVKLRDRIGRVVVGVDGSPQSESALRWAAAEADRRAEELCVVHAWEYPYVATMTGRDFAEVDAGTLLEASVRTARENCAGTVSSALVEGSAVAALLEESESADLVVVGSRGRGGFRSMLFGSVAHGVVAHASSPVVVVR